MEPAVIAAIGETVVGGALPVAVALALAAGVVSFLSPCVLPLVPGYLAFVSGLSGASGSAARGEGAAARQQADDKGHAPAGDGSVATTAPPVPRRAVVLPASLLFVLGFAVFFTLLGGAFGALGVALIRAQRVVEVVGGVLVVALGLFLLGVVRPGLLHRDTRRFTAVRRGGIASAFPLGLVFGAGWTPCVGPTLAAVLTLSASDGGGATRGAVLAFAYALGLGLPFVAVGLGLERGLASVAALRRWSPVVQRVGGVALVVVGVLLLSGLWQRFLATVQPWIGGGTTLL